MKKIFILLMGVMVLSLISPVESAQNDFEIINTNQDFNITYYDNEYFDFKTGNILTYSNHVTSPTGFDNSYANNWVRSEVLSLEQLSFNFNVSDITRLSFKNKPHYLFLWNQLDEFVGYYKFKNIPTSYDYFTGNYLGWKNYMDVDIESILQDNNAFYFATIVNKDGLDSNISEGYTYNDYLNNLPYKDALLPNGDNPYEHVSNLFNEKGYSYINSLELPTTNVTVNGIDFIYDNVNKTVTLNGTATSTFYHQVSNSLDLLYGVIPAGLFYVELLNGAYTGVEGSRVVMSDSTGLLSPSTVTMIEFYDLENMSLPAYDERVNYYNGNYYDSISFFINSGDSFNNATYEIGYNYDLGDTYIDITDESVYDSIPPITVINNGYNSLLVNNDSLIEKPLYSQLNDYSTFYDFKNRLYYVDTIIDNYYNTTGYTINKNGYSTYIDSLDSYMLFSYINFLNGENLLKIDKYDNEHSRTTWEQNIVGDKLQVKVTLENGGNINLSDIKSYNLWLYGNEYFNMTNTSYLKLSNGYEDIYKEYLPTVFENHTSFYDFEEIQGVSLRSVISDLELEEYTNIRELVLVLNTDRTTLLNELEFNEIKEDFILKVNDYHEGINTFSFRGLRDLKNNALAGHTVDTEFQFYTYLNMLNIYNQRNTVIDDKVILAYDFLYDTFTSYDSYLLHNYNITALSQLDIDYDPLDNDFNIDYDAVIPLETTTEIPTTTPPIYDEINYGCYTYNVSMYYNDFIDNFDYFDTPQKWYYADLTTLSIEINDEIIILNGTINNWGDITYRIDTSTHLLYLEYIDNNEDSYIIEVFKDGISQYTTISPSRDGLVGNVDIRITFCYGGELEPISTNPPIDSPSTIDEGDNIPIGDRINDLFNESSNPTLFKILMVLVVIVIISIILFIYKAHWLIFILVNVTIILLFALLNIIPLWLVVIIGAILFISIILLNRSYT